MRKHSVKILWCSQHKIFKVFGYFTKLCMKRLFPVMSIPDVFVAIKLVTMNFGKNLEVRQ